MEYNPLRNVPQQAGPRGKVGSVSPVVLRETGRSRLQVNPWFVKRSSGMVETSLKLQLWRRPDQGVPWDEATRSEITLSPDEVPVLHSCLHEFLSLAGESEGDYIVLPLIGDAELDVDDIARKLAAVLAQPGVAARLAAMGLSTDIGSTLHGAARIADMRVAVDELRRRLDGGSVLEAIYQDWCERHSWAFGNAYVMRDNVRTVAVGDQVDLLMRASANGLRDVFELKRPNMQVINHDDSHKCWYWSHETVKAIAQCHRYLDVLHEQAGNGLRDHPDVVAYHPRAFIVVGRSAQWTEEQHRALHGLNSRLHSITVMTFDHLLAQAEALLATLTEPASLRR